MNRRLLRADHCGVEVVEEGKELLMPMLPLAGSDYLPGGNVECREQGGGAVPQGVVAALFG